MSINEVRYLPECGSTNAYVKEHFEEFGPVAAVYTENQTAGRGRLGRSWVNAEGKALYYTVAIKEPLAQPATLPLLASLAVRHQLQLRYGVDCQIKWTQRPFAERSKKSWASCAQSVSYGYQQQGRGILCGIGINLAQPQSYFDAADLPHGTSLALQGAAVDLSTDPAWLAEGLTDFGFDRSLYTLPGTALRPSGRSTRPPASIWDAGSPLTCRTAVRAQAKPWTWTPRGVWWCAPMPGNNTFSPGKCRCTASTGQCN